MPKFLTALMCAGRDAIISSRGIRGFLFPHPASPAITDWFSCHFPGRRRRLLRSVGEKSERLISDQQMSTAPSEYFISKNPWIVQVTGRYIPVTSQDTNWHSPCLRSILHKKKLSYWKLKLCHPRKGGDPFIYLSHTNLCTPYFFVKPLIIFSRCSQVRRMGSLVMPV